MGVIRESTVTFRVGSDRKMLALKLCEKYDVTLTQVMRKALDRFISEAMAPSLTLTRAAIIEEKKLKAMERIERSEMSWDKDRNGHVKRPLGPKRGMGAR